jgi:hypothetical protein
MTENDIFQNSSRNTKEERDFFIHLGTFRRYRISLSVSSANTSIMRKLTFPSPPSTSVFARIPSRVFIVNPPPFFTVTCRFLVAVIRCRFTFQNLSLTWAFTSFSFAISSSACLFANGSGSYLGIMYESTTLGIRWHITCSRIFEAFNDCLHSAHHSTPQWYVAYSLSTTIMTNDYGQGRIKLDDLNMFIVERPDPTDCELVQGCPGLSVPRGYGGLHGDWRARRACLELCVDLSTGSQASAVPSYDSRVRQWGIDGGKEMMSWMKCLDDLHFVISRVNQPRLNTLKLIQIDLLLTIEWHKTLSIIYLSNRSPGQQSQDGLGMSDSDHRKAGELIV